MSILLTAVPSLDAQLPDGPVHRLIFAVDIEGSTERNNPAKGQLRRILYELLDRALEASGIAARHLEPYTDRGDSVLVLIKPHDDVPKTLVLGLLVPTLTALLTEYNVSPPGRSCGCGCGPWCTPARSTTTTRASTVMTSTPLSGC